MKHYKLDKEERKILKAYEIGKLKAIKLSEKEREKYRAIARYTLAKRKNINIRVSERDLHRLKARAAELGLPYQTLVSSILHQYSNKTDHKTSAW